VDFLVTEWVATGINFLLLKIITPSQFAQSVLMLKGKPFRFNLHAPFEPVYNWPTDGLLLKTARQVGKSTMLAGKVITSSMLGPNRRTFYASTSERQAREFARVKLNEFLARSPIARKYLLNKHSYDVKDSLFDKNFSNGSGITISYMKDNADRTRGYSADDLYLDEIQDMDPNELPVVLEILSASLDPKKIFAGTPKTIENPIEQMWQRSTQHEIFFKCKKCNKWNNIGYKNIGKKGPMCAVCGGDLDMEHFDIIATAPEPEKQPRIGIRIPQPALRLHYGFEKKWKDILQKYEEYDEAKFNNEVLGISYSKGTRFLTEQDILEQCHPWGLLESSHYTQQRRMFDVVVAGIDWSGGGSDFSSKTVLTIYGRLAGDAKQRLRLIYYKIYPAQDYMITINDIKRKLAFYKPTKIGADAGEGALNNSYLADAFGGDVVQPFRYGKFDKLIKLSQDKYTVYVDKTTALDDFFKALKGGKFLFPKPQLMGEPIKHMLSEHEHVTNNGYRIWQRGMYSDDFLHASVFAYNAYKIAAGMVRFY